MVPQSLWNLGGDDDIGRLLAAERKRQGISQKALANKIGITAANLSRIERGSDLRVSTLLEISRNLGFEPMFVPKRASAAVRSVVENLIDGQPSERGRFT